MQHHKVCTEADIKITIGNVYKSVISYQMHFDLPFLKIWIMVLDSVGSVTCISQQNFSCSDIRGKLLGLCTSLVLTAVIVNMS